MASFLKKAQLYLGLGPDEEYEDYEDYMDRPGPVAAPDGRDGSGAIDLRDDGDSAASGPARPAASRPGSRPASARQAPAPAPAPRSGRDLPVRARPAPVPGSPEPMREAVRAVPPKPHATDAPPPPSRAKPVVRPVASNVRPSVITPKSFNHAQEVADKFKLNQPVILNLQGAEKELARRLLDFSSGICYALSGHMEKVASRVYLLRPTNVEVSPEERRRLQERGLHDA
jgi:cell division inhibitor SepF